MADFNAQRPNDVFLKAMYGEFPTPASTLGNITYRTTEIVKQRGGPHFNPFAVDPRSFSTKVQKMTEVVLVILI